jgi:membrane carboxypeptidase/penicillin-binding protein
MRTGLARVADLAAEFGLPRPDAYPSTALGASEATPLQIAAAYAAFANGGTVFAPTVIAKLIDNSTGERIDKGLSKSEQVIKPGTAYMITDILADVTRRGTARRANASFKNVAIAGKTGTSRDGWFVGYSPNLVCAVWVGFDDNQQLGLTGAEAALPAWIEFMKEAIAIRPSLGGSSFAKPGGIVSARIDPETGELAGPNCPTAQNVSVAIQFAPRGECFKHLPALESQDQTIESASMSELDPAIRDYGSLGLEPSDESTEQTLSASNERAGDREGELPPTGVSKGTRHTEIELSPTGRPRLINAPGVSNDTLPPKSVANHRP